MTELKNDRYLRALLRQDESLSFGERKMYDKASRLLIQGIAFARDTDEHSVEKELDELFSAPKA